MSFWNALKKWLSEIFAPVAAKPLPQTPIQKPEPKGTPWRDWFVVRKGWTEFTHDAELSKGWRLTKFCKSYKTVIGVKHAWCGMSLATALDSCGMSYPEQCETASEWKGYGTPINWKAAGIPKGAVVVVQGESFHVAVANRDHLPGEVFVELLGGNQDNAIKVKNDYRAVVYVGWPVR